MHGFHQSIILLTKAFLFFTWCAVMVPPQALIMAVHRGRFSYLFPQLWHKGTCALFGLTVIVDGTPVTNRQTLFIANHVSYLDIPVMGSILQASFIAKKSQGGQSSGFCRNYSRRLLSAGHAPTRRRKRTPCRICWTKAKALSCSRKEHRPMAARLHRLNRRCSA